MKSFFPFVISVMILVFAAGCKDKTTGPDLSLPQIVMQEAAQVNSGLPTLSFLVESAGTTPLVKLTLCWGESPNPDLNGFHRNFSAYDYETPFQMGHTLYSLNPGATYYARVYAENSDGHMWSNQVSFSMLPMLWDTIDLGTNSSLTKVHFHNENIGWICGSGGVLKKSTDSGTTWTSVSSGTSSYLSDMHWVNETEGWIAGSNPNIVLRTTNGGVSWQSVALDFVPANHLSAIYFEDSLAGYLLTIYGGVHKTTDGGASWTQIRSDGSWTFNDIWALGETIIIAGQGLRISDDGGSSWRYQLVLDHEYYEILHRGPGTLWVVGETSNGGALYKSEDLGLSWTSINTRSRFATRSISLAPGTQKLWIAGSYGSIHDSGDDGLTWRINYNLLNSTMFQSVYAASDSKVWIVGSAGTLLRLQDNKR